MNHNWHKYSLDELATVVNGYSFKSGDFSTENEVQSIKITNVGVQEFIEDTEQFLPSAYSDKYSNYLADSGDIVIALTRTLISTGLKVAIVSDKFNGALINQRVAALKANPDILDKSFLYYYLTSQYAYNYVKGTVNELMQPNLSIKDLKSFTIFCPTIPEQKRIVALLDTVFADLEQTRAKTEQNLKNARELFDSYLQDVFSQTDKGWVIKPLDSFSKIVNGHAFKSGDFSPNNSIKSIKITNVGVFEFVEESDNLLPEDYSVKYNQYKAYEGDVLVALTRTIISAGLKVAVVPSSYHGALINQRVAAVHVNEEIMPKEMLQAFLSTNMAINYVRSNVNELMQPNLSIKDLKAFPVPVPPTNKKESVKNEIAVILKQKDKLVRVYTQKLDAIDELKKSILQKAFRGELTKTVE